MLRIRSWAIDRDRQQLLVLLLTMFAGVCGFMLMNWVTEFGPGVCPDSATYIAAAQNLLAGYGLSVGGQPMTHYAPAYSLLLAMTDLILNGDMLQAGQFLSAFFFGASAVLVGLGVYLSTKHSRSATACALLVFLVSAPNQEVHAWLWSEAPYITFSLAACLFLSLHVRRPALPLLVMAASMAALAVATRYIGVTLLPTMIFVLLVFGDRAMQRRIRDSVLTSIIVALPLAAWLIRNVVMADTAADRAFAIHPVGLVHAATFVSTVHDFVLPISVSYRIKALDLAVCAALLLLAVVLLRRINYRWDSDKLFSSTLPAICFVYALMYVSFLGVSISFFDAATPLNNRILVPALIPLTITGISLAWSIAGVLHRRFIWYGLVCFAFLSISTNSIDAVSQALAIRRDGLGYTSRYWRSSELMLYLATDLDARKIYSNFPDALRFLAAKEAVMLPFMDFPGTLQSNQNYRDQLSRMSEDCRQGKAVIAYFYNNYRWYLPSLAELKSTGSLPILKTFTDGVLYATELEPQVK